MTMGQIMTHYRSALLCCCRPPCSVNVKNLSRTTDIPNLAKQVVATCQLINPARLAEVEQLLLYMQARKTTNEGDAG